VPILFQGGRYGNVDCNSIVHTLDSSLGDTATAIH
jgi:hypothetical protein